MITPIKFLQTKTDLPQLVYVDDRDQIPNALFTGIMEWLVTTPQKQMALAIQEKNARGEFKGLLKWERKFYRVKAGTGAHYFYDAAFGVAPVKHQLLGPLRKIEKDGKLIHKQDFPRLLKGKPRYLFDMDPASYEAMSEIRPRFYCPVSRDLFPEGYVFDMEVEREKFEKENGVSKAEPDDEFADVDLEFQPEAESKLSDEESFADLMFSEMPESNATPESMAESLKRRTIKEDVFSPVDGVEFRVLTARNGVDGEHVTMTFRPDGELVPDLLRKWKKGEPHFEGHNELIVFIREGVQRHGYATGRL